MKDSPHTYSWVMTEPQLVPGESVDSKWIFLPQAEQATAYISSSGWPHT
jgi:hypothetical protein